MKCHIRLYIGASGLSHGMDRVGCSLSDNNEQSDSSLAIYFLLGIVYMMVHIYKWPASPAWRLRVEGLVCIRSKPRCVSYM